MIVCSGARNAKIDEKLNIWRVPEVLEALMIPAGQSHDFDSKLFVVIR
jgi:hypothetical protein